MGTTWSLRAVAPPPGAAAGVQAVLDRVVAQMSQWEAESDISRFNRTAAGNWVMLPPEFIHVLEAALQVFSRSQGAFDPAVGALSDLWGFGPAPAPGIAPPCRITDRLIAAKGSVDLDALGLRARRRGEARLDFSGIAKGFGVDLASGWLLDRGCRHFLLEVGGELRGHGVQPDGLPWWVDIELPPGATVPPLRAALCGLAIATSGDYRRWLEADGQRYCHSIDPRTGRPVENGVHSVTVLHPQCMMADAWATALTVLGPEAGMQLAAGEGLAAHMLTGDGEFLSPTLAMMLD